MSDIDICIAEGSEGIAAAGASELKALLADIVACRDECRGAEKNLLPAADPLGDARIAFGTVANQLDALIKRHSG